MLDEAGSQHGMKTTAQICHFGLVSFLAVQEFCINRFEVDLEQAERDLHGCSFFFLYVIQ